MEFLYYILAAVAGIALGYVITVAVQKSLARNRAKTIIDDAKREAEVLKKNKVLEAREEELKIKAEAEKQANQRFSKIQSMEAKIKQRELMLNQQQSENQRTKNELETTRINLESQIAVVENKKANTFRKNVLNEYIEKDDYYILHIT